jgi:vWA-MoxR associated protein C-terminal domain
MSEKEIDASQSQGLIYNPQSGVGIDQHYGDRSSTETGGGDSAGRDVDKRNISQVFNLFLGGSSLGETSQQSIQQLVQILGQMGTDSVKLAYRNSLPMDAGLSRSEAIDFGNMVTQLQEFRRLPEFVEQLVGDRSTPESIRRQLNDLIQQWNGMEQPKQSSTLVDLPQVKLQSYLQIVVNSDFGSDGFVINGWLIPDDSVQDAGRRFQPLDLEDETKGTACKLEQVPEKLDKFLNQSLSLLRGKRYDLTIEVFLPLDYLCTEIDRWKLSHPDLGDEYLVGAEYRIVVRSSERLNLKYIDQRWNKWCTNWDRLRECWHKAPDASDFEHFSQSEDCNWKRVGNSLTQKLGLKLTCGLIEAQQKELFMQVLKAAAPIAIWVRCDLPHLDSVAEIDELLGMGPLLDLVEKVLKRRNEADMADCPESHLGSHLALMWEDPNRLTPDVMAQLIPTGQ